MRLFLAYPVPAEVKEVLVATQARWREAPGAGGASWPKPGTLHVTVRFLGEVAPDRVPAIVEAVGTAWGDGPPGLVLSLAGPWVRPGTDRPSNPHVLAVRIAADPDLAPWVERLGAALAPLGFPPEGRRHDPHLTLARLRAPARAHPLDVPGAHWGAPQLVLYESHLEPQGARHVALAAWPAAAGSL